jgi:23S rRNA (pseudouridine1915-N3)-methyltransferase
VRIRVIWFGRPGGSPYEAEVATYRRRTGRRWPAEDLPLKPVRSGRDGDPRRAVAAEGEAARRLVPAGWRLVTLEEGGRTLTSEAVAQWLAGAEADGRDGVALVVGSDLGLAPELCASADLRLSLGAVTLPHLIARLVVWEQLFRASDILAGGAYHRRGVDLPAAARPGASSRLK